MNGVQIKRVADGHGDEGVARHEWIVRPVRLVGPLQNANPFRVADLKTSSVKVIIIIVKVLDPAVGVVTAVAVEIQIVTEIGRSGRIRLGMKTGGRGL